MIQDRQFNSDGTFRYPVSTIPGVTWIGEYFGDTMLVNGKVWPYLNVEPRLYRFRILNGCNARIMSLDMGGAPMWQIGAEGGMLDRPVRMNQLVLTSAERADVIVDFRGLEGRTLIVRNTTPAAPVSTPAPAAADGHADPGRHVGDAPRAARHPARPARSCGADLRRPDATRYITLNEIAAETAGW